MAKVARCLRLEFGKSAGRTEADVWFLGLYGAQYLAAKTKLPSVSECECAGPCGRKIYLILQITTGQDATALT